MKKIKIIFSVFLILLLAGGAYLYLNLSDILTRTTERVASDALGVSVDIGTINLSLTDKSVTVQGITVANPAGYSSPHAIAIDNVTIALNSVSEELIEFKNIQVSGTDVNLEANQNGMNLVDLKNKAQSKAQSSEKEASSDQGQGDDEKNIQVIIKSMIINESTIHPHVPLVSSDITSIVMPAVKFSNIGDKATTNADEVIVQILTKYIGAVQKEASKSGIFSGLSIPGIDDGGAKKVIDGAKDTIKGLFQ